MKFRLISRFGDGLGLAWRLSQTGHDVDFYITEPASERLYAGLLKRVDRWNKDLTAETVVLFDMSGHGKIADSIRQTGHKVYGGGGLNDQLELDRHFARQVAKNAGINVPETETYADYAEAITEIRRRDGGWVYRPVNHSPAPYTYVASSTIEMQIMLEHFRRSAPHAQQEFTLQPMVPGVEVSIECWYVRGEPILSTLNSTLEATRFLTGGLGPRTGCQGSVAWFWKNPTNKLYRFTHEKLRPFLQRYRYDGPLNVRVIVMESDKRPVFLDFTARFGFNAIYALCEDLGVDLAELLSGAAGGESVALKPSYAWCGALRVTTPPFPYRLGKTFAGKPLARVDRASPHFWPLDVFESEGRLLTAGGDGVVCELTARAPGLRELGKALYGPAGDLILPDKQYRTDLIEHAQQDIERLTAWKYLKKTKMREHVNA